MLGVGIVAIVIRWSWWKKDVSGDDVCDLIGGVIFWPWFMISMGCKLFQSAIAYLRIVLPTTSTPAYNTIMATEKTYELDSVAYDGMELESVQLPPAKPVKKPTTIFIEKRRNFDDKAPAKTKIARQKPVAFLADPFDTAVGIDAIQEPKSARKPIIVHPGGWFPQRGCCNYEVLPLASYCPRCGRSKTAHNLQLDQARRLAQYPLRDKPNYSYFKLLIRPMFRKPLLYTLWFVVLFFFLKWLGS